MQLVGRFLQRQQYKIRRASMEADALKIREDTMENSKNTYPSQVLDNVKAL